MVEYKLIEDIIDLLMSMTRRIDMKVDYVYLHGIYMEYIQRMQLKGA